MPKLASLLLLSTLALAETRPDVSSIVSRAQHLVETGQLAQAQQLLDGALRNLPGNPDLEFGLGMVYLRERNWEKAIEHYQTSLKASPKRAKTLFYLSEAYFENSDFHKACDTLAETVNIDPKDALVRQKYGEYLASRLASRNQGLQQLQKAHQLNPELPRIDFDIGKAQFDLTDYPSASESFQRELVKKPGDGEASFFLAEANSKLGNWQKARQAYESSLAHGYNVAPAYYGLGKTLVQLEDFNGSLAPLQHSLALQPSLIEAHFQLSKAYQRLGMLDDARHETKLFAAMNGRVNTAQESRAPELDDAWKYLKPLLAEQKEPQALTYLTKLSDADPVNFGNPAYLLGEMYFTLGRVEDARRMLLTASNQSPNDAHVAAYLGIVQLASGESDAAERSLTTALSLDQDEPLALIGLGGIRYRQERWADAITYLERSRTADPNALLLLCAAYLRTGKTDEALLTAEVIRAFASDSPSLLESLDELLNRYARGKSTS